MSDVLLKLNVSGTEVFVRQSTMENCGVRPLSALCNFEGKYIDRPLQPFLFVLNWVKTMGYAALPVSANAMLQVQHEAEYWQVDDLVGAIKQHRRLIDELSGVSPPFNMYRIEDRERASAWMRERNGMLRVCVQNVGEGEIVVVSSGEV